MKNNRLTNMEIFQIKESAEEIKRLCKLETASFSPDKEKDEEIKNAIKPWLMWFEIEAQKINSIITK
jgi:hypothetical protein